MIKFIKKAALWLVSIPARFFHGGGVLIASAASVVSKGSTLSPRKLWSLSQASPPTPMNIAMAWALPIGIIICPWWLIGAAFLIDSSMYAYHLYYAARFNEMWYR